MRSVTYLSALAALVAPTLAQTFTSCNPTLKKCPSDPALGTSVAFDFTKGAPSGFTAAAGKAPVFKSDGAYFSITQKGEAPTLSSNWFIMFGHYKVVMKPAPGQGIVSSLVLQSDDLDEIDWEWVGSQTGQVQTNYYGKGNTTVYDRGATLTDGKNSDGFNTYEIDWTADHVQWIINGAVVRTLTPATADYNQYPQTPMQFKIGNWAAGDSSSPGTVQWAGGPVNYANQPFNMIVKSVEVNDYSTGKSYSYGDTSGKWESIVADGGKVNSAGSVPSSVSTASASGSSITGSPTASALSNQQPISASTTNTSQLASGVVSSRFTSGFSNSTHSTQAASSTAGASGSGSSQSGSGATTSASASSSTSSSTTGAGSHVKPVAGLAVAGLFAIFAL